VATKKDTTAEQGVAPVRVAQPVASKEDYLKAAAGLRPGFGATADSGDGSVGWTVGSGTPAPEALDSTPGQVFSLSELPDPEVALSAGFVPQRIPADLIIGDGEVHPQGPEPSTVVGSDAREELRDAIIAAANPSDAAKPAPASAAPAK